MFSRTLGLMTVLLGVGVGLLAVGCAVGPGYRSPQTAMPANWAGPTPSAATQPSVAVADLARWWEGFGDATLSSLVERAVQSNLDIRRAEAGIHAATARIGVATTALFPTFTLSGSAGLQGSQMDQWFDWQNRLWSLGPSMNWTIFNSGANLWNIEIQDALTQQTLLTYQQAVLTAMQDAENALVASANEQEHRKALVQAVAANQKAVGLAMQLYALGQTDFLNVLDAQRSLYSSQDALVQSTRNVSTDLVALYKALGGGWSEAATAKPQPSHVPFGGVLNQISGGKLAPPTAATQPVDAK